MEKKSDALELNNLGKINIKGHSKILQCFYCIISPIAQNATTLSKDTNTSQNLAGICCSTCNARLEHSRTMAARKLHHSSDKVHTSSLKEATQNPPARAILPSFNSALPIWMSVYCVHK